MDSLKVLALFAEGLLSFFSPCVLPILPVYIGILGGQATVADQEQDARHSQRQVLVNTLFFILGITITFFILAFASSLMSRFMIQYRTLLTVLGAVLIILMGLIQLGALHISVMNKEFSAKYKVYQTGQKMTPLLAILMGFTFSFSWSPCIGPILASVFIYASSHHSLFSIFLISVYSLGFILPFLLVAMFSQKVLAYFKHHYHLLKYTKIISGALLVLIGLSILFSHFV